MWPVAAGRPTPDPHDKTLIIFGLPGPRPALDRLFGPETLQFTLCTRIFSTFFYSRSFLVKFLPRARFAKKMWRKVKSEVFAVFL